MIATETETATVQVGTGEGVKDVPHVPGMTVGAALSAAGIANPKGNIAVNGQKAELTTPLNPGDKVTLAPKGKNG